MVSAHSSSHTAAALPWSEVLPTEFDFYHLGWVESHPTQSPPEDNELIYFKIYSQPSVVLVCSFPFQVQPASFTQSVEDSIYIEVGNILASRLLTGLKVSKDTAYWISPPEKLSPETFQSWINSENVLLERTYVHRFLEKNTLIHVFIFNHLENGEGNA